MMAGWHGHDKEPSGEPLIHIMKLYNIAEIEKLHVQLAASQAEILGLRDVLKLVLDQAIVGRTFPATASRTAWFNAVPIALSAPPGDQSALREVIAQVLDEVVMQIQPEDSYQDGWFRGKADSYGKVEWLISKLRSGEWTPEVLK